MALVAICKCGNDFPASTTVCPRCGNAGPFGRQRAEWQQKRELYEAPRAERPGGMRLLKWVGLAVLGSVGALTLLDL